jgi:hypothetical protein
MKNKKLMWGGRDNVSIPYMLFCFTAGTQILMRNDATKNIEDIEIGDVVQSWNETSGEVENSKVVKLIQPVHDDMLVIRFSNDVVNENTFDHPYYVKDKGWCSYSPTLTKERYDINSELLEVGDICYFNNSDELEEVEIIFIKENWGEVQTYIFELDNNYTFFANGILTHNKCFPSGTKITMGDNTIKNIENVVSGEKVFSYNLKTNEKDVSLVGEVEELIDELFVLNEGMIETSNQHPFYVLKKDGSKVWASLDKEATILNFPTLHYVKELELGDKLLTQDDEWVELTSIEKKPGSYTAYNLLSVGENENYYANGFLVHNEFSSLELESIVVSGSSLEGSSSIQTHEDMNVGDTVLAASIEGLPDTDDASEFLLWEYTGSDIASQITLVTASIESITTSSHADFKIIDCNNASGVGVKISDNHPLLAKSESIWAFEYVGDIDATYTLVSSSLEEVAINTITQITGSEQTGSFRRFDIEPQDTYFADGILVHN